METGNNTSDMDPMRTIQDPEKVKTYPGTRNPKCEWEAKLNLKPCARQGSNIKRPPSVGQIGNHRGRGRPARTRWTGQNQCKNTRE